MTVFFQLHLVSWARSAREWNLIKTCACKYNGSTVRLRKMRACCDTQYFITSQYPFSPALPAAAPHPSEVWSWTLFCSVLSLTISNLIHLHASNTITDAPRYLFWVFMPPWASHVHTCAPPWRKALENLMCIQCYRPSYLPENCLQQLVRSEFQHSEGF